MAHYITSEDIVGAPRSAESLRSLADIFDKSPIVSTKELAQELELTDRRILQLVDEGFLFKKGRNEFNLYECLHNYILYQRRMKVKELLRLDE